MVASIAACSLSQPVVSAAWLVWLRIYDLSFGLGSGGGGEGGGRGVMVGFDEAIVALRW